MSLFKKTPYKIVIPVFGLISYYSYEKQQSYFNKPDLGAYIKSFISEKIPFLSNDNNFDVTEFKPLRKFDKNLYEKYVLNKRRIDNLPKTNSVILMKNEKGDNIIIVGTFHRCGFSKEIVKEVIKNVLPDIVTLELDNSRFYQTLKENSKMQIYCKPENYLLELLKKTPAFFDMFFRIGIVSIPGVNQISLLTEFDKAIEESRNIPYTSIHPVDSATYILAFSIIKDIFKLDWTESRSYVASVITPIKLLDILNDTKYEEISRKNYEIFMSEESLKRMPFEKITEMRNRNESMANKILNIISKRRDEFTSKNIDSPVYCVTIIGAGHIPGLISILIDKGYQTFYI